MKVLLRSMDFVFWTWTEAGETWCIDVAHRLHACELCRICLHVCYETGKCLDLREVKYVVNERYYIVEFWSL